MSAKLLLAATVALFLTVAAPARADDILFDPDGAGGTAAFTISGIDWLEGNGIAIEANVTSTPGTDFQFYYQSAMSTADNVIDDNPVNDIGNGEFGVYFTVVLGFGETLDTITGNPADGVGTTALNFTFDGTAQYNFFQIYANTAFNLNELNGVCYICGDLILSGHVIATDFTSSFTINEASGIQPLDQNSTDDYPTVDSFVGSGSTLLRVAVDSYDTSYFQGIGSTITFATNDATQTIPFDNADPAACFFATAIAGTVINPACTGAVNGGAGDDFFDTVGKSAEVGVGSVDACTLAGPLNGLLINGCAGSTMLEIDGNTSFETQAGVIPEPATLGLLGLGLLGIAAARRRSQKKQ